MEILVHLLGAPLMGQNPWEGGEEGDAGPAQCRDQGTALSEHRSWHIRAHEAAHPRPRARNLDVLIRFSNVI